MAEEHTQTTKESLADELSGLDSLEGQAAAKQVQPSQPQKTLEEAKEKEPEKQQQKEPEKEVVKQEQPARQQKDSTKEEKKDEQIQKVIQKKEEAEVKEVVKEEKKEEPVEVKQEKVEQKHELQIKKQGQSLPKSTEEVVQQEKPVAQSQGAEHKEEIKPPEKPQQKALQKQEEFILPQQPKKSEQAASPRELQASKQQTTEKVAGKEGDKTKQQAQPKKRRKRVFKDKQKQKQQLPSSTQAPVASTQPHQQPPQQPPPPQSQPIHSVLSQVQHPYTHEDDTRILSDTSFSKKKQNYMQLREWSRLRSEHMALHLNVVDELQTELEKILKSSMDNLEMYNSFFRERANQEDKYACHPIINTHFATMSNELSKDIYINCSRLLNSLGDQNLERCKRSQTLALFIRKNILIDNIQDHVKRTHIEMLKVRQRISTSRNALLKCRDQIDKKIVKMAARYNSYITQFNHNPNKDFLKTQLGYLRRTYEQSQIQRKLGEHVYEYLKMAADEEIKRAEVIKKSIRLYTDAMKAAYDIKPDEDGLMQLDKEEEGKLIPEFYAVEELIDPKFVDLLKKMHKIEGQLTMPVLREYLFSLKPFNFNSRLLVLKQYPILNTITKDKQYPGKLLISVDSFLHFFFDGQSQSPFSKPSLSIKIDKTLDIKSNRDLVVELSRKEQKKNVLSYLIWTKKPQSSVTVRFLKRDALEEFEEFVIKLI